MSIEKTIKAIVPVDRSPGTAIQAHLDDLTKPRGSLGRLEEFVMKYCLAVGSTKPILGKKKIFCFAGDHGVAEEGVSAYPSTVTPQMVRNMLAGGAAINVLASHVGAELLVIDIGVNDPLDDAPGLCRRKVRSGTGNIAQGPAMSMKEARQAVMVGIALAQSAAEEGIGLIGTGEMGIANTTPASAVLAALLACAPDEVTGRGTGIDETTLRNKIQVIERALDVNRERLGDPLSTLAAVGGTEMAGICGLILGAASRRIPTVVDGFISSAGALVALRMNRDVLDYLFFSHVSDEKGHRLFLDAFDVEPMLDFRMRLGEGTGAALAISVVEASIRTYNSMATFTSAGVSDKG